MKNIIFFVKIATEYLRYQEKGKSIENGNDINIDYWDLKEEEIYME